MKKGLADFYSTEDVAKALGIDLSEIDRYDAPETRIEAQHGL
jgi:hypothetical protein